MLDLFPVPCPTPTGIPECPILDIVPTPPDPSNLLALTSPSILKSTRERMLIAAPLSALAYDSPPIDLLPRTLLTLVIALSWFSSILPGPPTGLLTGVVGVAIDCRFAARAAPLVGLVGAGDGTKAANDAIFLIRLMGCRGFSTLMPLYDVRRICDQILLAGSVAPSYSSMGEALDCEAGGSSSGAWCKGRSVR